MAKLRGKHMSLAQVREDLVKVMDETFPSDAPHHLIIVSDKEYKERQKRIGIFWGIKK